MQNSVCLFFLANNFFISSDILVQTTHILTETVTGTPAVVEAEFKESKCSEEIVDEKEEGEDE